MKIVSKQVITSELFDNGEYVDLVQKSIIITDNSFESLEIDEMHEVIRKAALLSRVKAKNRK